MASPEPRPFPLLQSGLFRARLDVRHGFTTNVDGHGQRLDLGRTTTASRWSEAGASLGLAEAAVARVHQVHGDGVRMVDQGGVAGEADALVTTTPGLILAVRTADCVPVLMVLGTPAIAVAAVHAGWRGVAAEVIAATVSMLRTISPSAPLSAAIGPAICGEHYEVGEEVVEAIVQTGVPESVFVSRPPQAHRPFADVRAAAHHQLAQLGVIAIDQLPHCTFSDSSLWSHRRDGLSRGSLASMIAMVPTR
jgi:YfiH family protein